MSILKYHLCETIYSWINWWGVVLFYFVHFLSHLKLFGTRTRLPVSALWKLEDFILILRTRELYGRCMQQKNHRKLNLLTWSYFNLTLENADKRLLTVLVNYLSFSMLLVKTTKSSIIVFQGFVMTKNAVVQLREKKALNVLILPNFHKLKRWKFPKTIFSSIWSVVVLLLGINITIGVVSFVKMNIRIKYILV